MAWQLKDRAAVNSSSWI